VTRATLLHVLDRPTALGPAEVRELEQLAQAFPYCQTAHLLLAKAAHDQGTMLASQRLRRAATYAADRTLLRRLIEMVEPVAEVETLTEAETESEPIAAPLALIETPVAVMAPPLPAPLETVTPVLAPMAAPEPFLAVAPAAEALVVEAIPAPAAEVFPPPIAVVATPLAEPEPPVVAVAEPVAAITPTDIDHDSVAAVEIPLALPIVEAPLVPVPIADIVSAAIAAAPLPVAPPEAPQVASEPLQEDAVESSQLVDREGPSILSTVPTAPVEEAVLEYIPIAEPSIPEADLPAQAPAIRPPVEVGEARFEFGLAEPAPPVVPTYELPGLVDEWAASAVTRSLGSPDALLPEATELLTPAFTPAAFTGDPAVGYSFGESSRLGLSMQLLDMLAAQTEAAEISTAVIAAAQPPAVVLPPTGTFFEPDPLLLDHWTTHCPPPPALPSSLDLINNFLKRQPRLSRPAMLPPAPGGQADLSVRSTNAAPDLVSENLARIYIRQGKIARAIEIYEKLKVKHPEKIAYFAAQIQSLQPSA
jgi:hypothetical protein